MPNFKQMITNFHLLEEIEISTERVRNVRNDDAITLNEKGRLINNELKVAETLNSHYINIVKTPCGQPSQALGNPKDQANYIASVDANSWCKLTIIKTIEVLIRLEKNVLILRYVVFLKQREKK